MPKKTSKKTEEAPVIERIPAKHVFTMEERDAMGRDLAARFQSINELTAEKSSMNKDFASRIEAEELAANRCALYLRDGFMMKDTECQVTFDWDGNTKEFTRTENGEFVERREITHSDRQLLLHT